MAITIRDITKTYRARKSPDVRALKGVNFDLPETGMVFILGKSGCGKSTLLNLLGGLDSFDSGDIIVDGKSMKGFSAKDYDNYRNDYTGFVFQENNLLNEYTVKRNVGLALDLQSQKDYDALIDEAIEAVELKDCRDCKCNRLSGGQKQRAAIARAIVKHPKLLLCDEPTGALDSETGEGVFGLLKKLSENTLVLVVSHDRESAEKYGERIIEMKDGAVISDSTPHAEKGEEKAAGMEGKKHGAMPVRRVFEIGASFLIARPVRLVLCVIICMLSFTCIGVADTFGSYDRLKAVEHTLNLCESSHLSFAKFDGYGENDVGNIPHAMNKAEGEKLSELLKSKRNDTLYRLYNLSYAYMQNDYGKIAEMDDSYLWFWLNGYIEVDGKFSDDYGFELYGRLPESLNEVVISKHVYDGFVKYGYEGDKVSSYDDIVGKNISIKDASKPSYMAADKVYKLVGILDTKYNDKLYKDVINGKNDYTINLQTLSQQGVHNALFTAKGFHVERVKEALALDIYKSETAETLLNVKSVITPKPDAKDLCADLRIYENYQNVTSSPEDEERTFTTFDLCNDVTEAINDVDGSMDLISKILYYVSIGLAVVSAMFVLYFTSGIVSEKRREVGILRALGASRRDVVNIFAAENGIFAVGIILLSTVLSITGVSVANGILTAQFGVKATLISFALRQFAILAAVAVAAVIVGIAIPIIKLLCKKPVDVIACR